MSKAIKIPGADHPITIARNPARVIVRLGATVIADTTEALALREASYGAVQYIPRKDVDMSRLERTDHASYCPYKGEASYFSVKESGPRLANAVWTYEVPHAAVAAIGSYLAFIPTASRSSSRPRPDSLATRRRFRRVGPHRLDRPTAVGLRAFRLDFFHGGVETRPFFLAQLLAGLFDRGFATAHSQFLFYLWGRPNQIFRPMRVWRAKETL